MFSKPLTRLAALLLCGVYLFDGLIVGLAHNHAPCQQSLCTSSAKQQCDAGHCHGHAHTHASHHPESHHDHLPGQAPAAPCDDRHDDCVACRFLALSAIPVVDLAPPLTGGLEAPAAVWPAAAPLSQSLDIYRARAPPLA